MMLLQTRRICDKAPSVHLDVLHLLFPLERCILATIKSSSDQPRQPFDVLSHSSCIRPSPTPTRILSKSPEHEKDLHHISALWRCCTHKDITRIQSTLLRLMLLWSLLLHLPIQLCELCVWPHGDRLHRCALYIRVPCSL